MAGSSPARRFSTASRSLISIALRSNPCASYPRRPSSRTNSTPSWPELPRTTAFFAIEQAGYRSRGLYCLFFLHRFVQKTLRQPRQLQRIEKRVFERESDLELALAGFAAAYFSQKK